METFHFHFGLHMLTESLNKLVFINLQKHNTIFYTVEFLDPNYGLIRVHYLETKGYVYIYIYIYLYLVRNFILECNL